MAGHQEFDCFVCVQGNEKNLILEEVNGYQRAIQYQQLEKPQFGAAQPPGFYFEVKLHIPIIFL